MRPGALSASSDDRPSGASARYLEHDVMCLRSSRPAESVHDEMAALNDRPCHPDRVGSLHPGMGKGVPQFHCGPHTLGILAAKTSFALRSVDEIVETRSLAGLREHDLAQRRLHRLKRDEACDRHEVVVEPRVGEQAPRRCQQLTDAGRHSVGYKLTPLVSDAGE